MKAHFSWLDIDDVCKKLELTPEKAKGIITPYGSDQGSCDACWAFHLAQVMSDRIRIRKKDNTFPQLSPMQLLLESGRFCSGGSFEQGVELLKTKGVSTLCCDPYEASNISLKQTCSVGYRGFSSIFGKAPVNLDWKCGLENKKFKIRKCSDRELSTENVKIHSIRKAEYRIMDEIYKNGPVVCRISIFIDFLDPRNKTRGVNEKFPFEETNGVYMNIIGEKSLYYNISNDGGKTCNQSSSCDINGHGLSIVGWGETTWTDVPQTGERVEQALRSSIRKEGVRHLSKLVDAKYKSKSNKGMLRISYDDLEKMLKQVFTKEEKEKCESLLCKTQVVKYWILRNSWGKNKHVGSYDKDYSNGVLKVAFCDYYTINGNKRLVNLTSGIEHRFHCGSTKPVTLCGGSLNPGTPIIT